MTIDTTNGHKAMDYREHIRTYDGFLNDIGAFHELAHPVVHQRAALLLGAAAGPHVVALLLDDVGDNRRGCVGPTLESDSDSVADSRLSALVSGRGCVVAGGERVVQLARPVAHR